MMKRLTLFISILILGIFVSACSNNMDAPSIGEDMELIVEEGKKKLDSVEEEITSLVKEFGSRLKNVSLLAPEKILIEEMEENYGGLVAPSLMERWLEDPENAPGRLVSSPWPEEIQIESIEEIGEDRYEVMGQIIELTSNEEDKAITRPIKLTIEYTEEGWLITDVILD